MMEDKLDELEKKANVNRKLTIFKHRKKQASNDAQLLMNRIALLQKEEERARKKIDDTKERASEIITMRNENEKRMKEYLGAGDQEKKLREELNRRNKERDEATKKALEQVHGQILNRRKENAAALQGQKKQLTKFMIKEQEKELRLKQKKRDEVKRIQEAAKAKREKERKEKERRTREIYEKKAQAEEEEARKAEKLVKELERKEREWISKLKDAQNIQEYAYEELETALTKMPASPVGRSSPQK
jgi:hypothetical protein